MTTETAYDARAYDQKMSDFMSTNTESNFFTEWEETFDSFDQMGLHENLLRGIYAYGFEKPSAIQQKGIVPFTKQLDVIQQAQSGTGKEWQSRRRVRVCQCYCSSALPRQPLLAAKAALVADVTQLA